MKQFIGQLVGIAQKEPEDRIYLGRVVGMFDIEYTHTPDLQPLVANYIGQGLILNAGQRVLITHTSTITVLSVSRYYELKAKAEEMMASANNGQQGEGITEEHGQHDVEST